MKLLRFCVTNFRSVSDSGWIDVTNVNAFIGVNESGKTNLLLPLWKFKPAREGAIVPTSDYPKSMFTEIRASPENFTFITAVFDCSSIADQLADLTNFSADVLDEVRIWRKYHGKYYYEFPKCEIKRRFDIQEFVALLDSAKNEISSAKAQIKEEATKVSVLAEINSTIAYARGEAYLVASEMKAFKERLEKLTPDNPPKTSSLAPAISRLYQAVDEIESLLEIKSPNQIKGVWDLVWAAVPSFVYYSNYGNLDSEIYLPHVVENMKREDLGAKEAAKVRTLRVLFDFVKLSPEEILELGRESITSPRSAQEAQAAEIEKTSEKKRERSTLLQSAGTQLTRRFKEWWKQGNYRFRFQADGNFFQIWVSDDQRPEEVELEGRSTGLQWFLSFYLVFLVESRGDHQNAILLLDEPGLSLHPLAQRDLSDFFEALAERNQLLYTTHSPFLVDSDHLDRVKKVYVNGEGKTQATEDLRQGAAETLRGAAYAVHSALNLSVAESLLLGCQPVIVEGSSDQHYLTAIKALLIGGGRINPARELVFPPSGGTKTARIIASILTGRDEELPVALLDSDVMGNKMSNELKAGLYVEDPSRIHGVAEFTAMELSEVEDLFPGKFVANVVDRLHRGPDEEFGDVHVSGKPILPQIQAWAEKNKVQLDKGWKVELAKRVKQQALLRGLEAFERPQVDMWVRLFSNFEPKKVD